MPAYDPSAPAFTGNSAIGCIAWEIGEAKAWLCLRPHAIMNDRHPRCSAKGRDVFGRGNVRPRKNERLANGSVWDSKSGPKQRNLPDQRADGANKTKSVRSCRGRPVPKNRSASPARANVRMDRGNSMGVHKSGARSSQRQTFSPPRYRLTGKKKSAAAEKFMFRGGDMVLWKWGGSRVRPVGGAVRAPHTTVRPFRAGAGTP